MSDPERDEETASDTATTPMSAEEARERFSEAADEFLDDADQAAFDAALAAYPELRDEYALFRDTLGGLKALGSLDRELPATREILPGVQKKLRERSRGRYYRDRFAETQGEAWPLILALVTILSVTLAWFALQFVTL